MSVAGHGQNISNREKARQREHDERVHDHDIDAAHETVVLVATVLYSLSAVLKGACIHDLEEPKVCEKYPVRVDRRETAYVFTVSNSVLERAPRLKHWAPIRDIFLIPWDAKR